MTDFRSILVDRRNVHSSAPHANSGPTDKSQSRSFPSRSIRHASAMRWRYSATILETVGSLTL